MSVFVNRAFVSVTVNMALASVFVNRAFMSVYVNRAFVSVFVNWACNTSLYYQFPFSCDIANFPAMTKITTYFPVVAAAPVLGKGLNPGSKIDLFVDTPPVRPRHKPSSSDAAKVSVLHDAVWNLVSWENCTSSVVTIIIPFCLCVIWCAKQSDSILFLRACVSSFVDLVKHGALTLVGEI